MGVWAVLLPSNFRHKVKRKSRGDEALAFVLPVLRATQTGKPAQHYHTDHMGRLNAWLEF